MESVSMLPSFQLTNSWSINTIRIAILSCAYIHACMYVCSVLQDLKSK